MLKALLHVPNSMNVLQLALCPFHCETDLTFTLIAKIFLVHLPSF